MRVLVATEAHFLRRPDGSVWARGPENYAFWSRYREGFDEVRVLARVGAGTAEEEGFSRADGEGVSFWDLDDYHGPWQYLARLARLRAASRAAAADADAFILRAPGAVAYLAFGAARRWQRPLAVEVLGDPWEALGAASGAAPLARGWSRRRLGELMSEAGAVCYVTRHRLQQRYPARSAAVFSCSDARVGRLASPDDLASRARRIELAARGQRRWRAGFIGSLEQPYKAADIHLRAVALCRRRGLDVELAVLGEGRLRLELERLATSLGLGAAAKFHRAVEPGASIAEFLDGLDLFVLASRAEGLPRALVEAMARGCPAVGSTAGGIPELLAAEDLVVAGDAAALAAKILEVLGDAARMAAMSRRNLVVAGEFTEERLGARRRAFLQEVRRQAEESKP